MSNDAGVAAESSKPAENAQGEGLAPGARFQEIGSGMYTVWELVASRYLHPDSLQTFASLSKIHRDILKASASSPNFWPCVKANAIKYAEENFDRRTLIVFHTLAASPIAMRIDKVVTVNGRLEARTDADMEDTEDDVRRFLQFCYFPVFRANECKTMLVFRNVPEYSSSNQDDIPSLPSRIAEIVHRHAKQSVKIRGAHRLNRENGNGSSPHPETRQYWSFSGNKVTNKSSRKRAPRRPVLVMFDSKKDADFVYARRGAFRKNGQVHLQHCSMPWDMDVRFKPGRRCWQ